MDALNYDRWQDFRRYALEPAVEEINKYSDIFVSWSELKEGRKVARIVFNVVHVSGEEINRRREKRWEKLGIEI
jgi:plasmid replication initiation protein